MEFNRRLERLRYHLAHSEISGIKFAVFDLAQSRLTPVRIEPNEREQRYPVFNAQNGITGTVILELLVDTNGRVERGSMHDRWNFGKPRPTRKSKRAEDARRESQ